MSDLISRSELLKEVEKYKFGAISNDAEREYIKKTILDFIICQPTTYDIDKVIEELKTKENEAILKAPNTSDLQNQEYQKWMMKSYGFKEAIEIVKQGGSDDVCEWESVSDGEFIKNPHTKRLYSNEPSMKNVYCNTCGKKIKIVGD